MDTNDQIIKVRDELKVVQPMIDISADRLNGLRTQCATSVDLTRQEIRTLEGKLLKMFARQLVTKSKLRGGVLNIFRDTPSVRQWLQVVGLQQDSIDGICERVDSIEALQEKSDHDLNNILKDRKANANEIRKLHRALYNLKRYTDILQRGDNNSEEPSDLELYWDSWERHRDKTSGSLSPHTSRNRSLTDTQHNTMTTPPEDESTYSKLSCNNYNNNNNNNQYRSSAESISSLNSRVQSPPATPTTKKSEKLKYISTPPPRKKHQAFREIIGLLPASFPLTKSKSHESQLSGKAPEAKDIPDLELLTTQTVRRGRLPTEPGLHSNSDLGSNTPSNISSTTASPSGIQFSPSRSPNSQKTSPDITSPSASLAHLSTTSSSIPPNSPQICSSLFSPCSSSSNASVHNSTQSPNIPGLIHRVNNSNNVGCYESSSTLPNSKIASPVNVSPNPSNPLSPVLYKRSPVKYLMGGSTHSQKIKYDSSPLAIHSTNSPVNLSPMKSLSQTPGCDDDYYREDVSNTEDFKKWDKRDNKEDISQATSIHIRHEIAHRFTKIYKMYAKCDYCDRQMLFETGLRCRECKFKCHRECEHHVPPSCGLPSEYMDEFKRRMIPNESDLDGDSDPCGGNLKTSTPVHQSSQSSSSQRMRKLSHPPATAGNSRHCDGNMPINGKSGSHPSSPAFGSRHSPGSKIHFSYPDVERELLGNAKAVDKNNRTEDFNDSDKAVSASDSGGSGSMDSDKNTQRVDSQESQVSDDAELVNDENVRNSQRWPRQNSQLSMREWDIPFDELKIGERIGTGRFGTVYRGNWHGDVAIKLLNMNYLDDDKALEAFKSEVGTFRKTRHENLVLFMGACMKPPRLAIVTSLSKGMTLYTHIHLRKDKFNMNKTTIVAQQITQGMGYLHARGIVHKDLKSKNIFLENGKVVITDFGLFSVTKLCYGNGKANTLNIPPGWLCYLAPEIVRSLRINQVHHELPFSKASDLYAFGTVWYELLCGEWPFKGQPPEAVIWQVGKGMKQPLANLQASRDVKDILMLCWTFRSENRPDFGELFNLLEKLPKKRLARSPSHPVHLSRSAESVF